jgi:hypothetical protein
MMGHESVDVFAVGYCWRFDRKPHNVIAELATTIVLVSLDPTFSATRECVHS